MFGVSVDETFETGAPHVAASKRVDYGVPSLLVFGRSGSKPLLCFGLCLDQY